MRREDGEVPYERQPPRGFYQQNEEDFFFTR